MAASGTTSTTSCTFTSSYSTWDGKQFADCCATSKPFTFVFCDQCDTDLELARCTTCYAKFASKLNRRLPEIASSMGGASAGAAAAAISPAEVSIYGLRVMGKRGL